MKRIIGLLIIILFSINVFGQSVITDISQIEATPKGMLTVEDGLRSGNLSVGSIRYVHFVKNGYLFMLAYEPSDKTYSNYKTIYRNIYLYRKDMSNVNNPWVIASDVVMTNFITDYKNYQEVDFSTGGRIMTDNNIVLITVTIYERKNNVWVDIDGCPNYSYQYITFKLVTNGDNFYTVIK